MRVLIVVLGVLLIVLSVFNGYFLWNQPRIAIVRSNDIIDKYKGTIEARSRFSGWKDDQLWKVDSLSQTFEVAVSDFRSAFTKLTLREQRLREDLLIQQKEQLERYSQAVESRIQEEDKRIMQGILNQINDVIRIYGESNNYTVVMGTAGEGNILFTAPSIDITDKVLAELNRKYEGL
jgi:outer membrane protein